MKVKLIHCANINMVDERDRAQKNIFYMPMGFLALADEVKKANYDIEIIHSDLLKGKIDEVVDFNDVDLIGLDCHWVNQSYHVLSFAKYIKERYPNTFIYLGGFTASLFCKEIVEKYDFIDAVSRGDGEVPIIELCDEISKDTDRNLNNVQNLIWRNENKEVIENKFTFRGTDESISKLNFSNFKLMRDWEEYQYFSKFWSDFDPIKSSNLYLLEVGRGCSYACTFCGGNCEAQYLMNNRKGYSVRSIESVLDTVESIVNQGFETLYTCFEFEGSDDYYIELFEKIKEKGYKLNYVFGGWRLPSKRLVNKLSECFENVILEISPETSSEELRMFNKDKRNYYSNAEMEEILDLISNKDNVKAQIYFGYYLINDNDKTITSTIKYILDLLLKYQDFIEVEYTNFSTDPGSLLFLHPEKYNVDIDVRNLEDYIRVIKEKYINAKDLTADMKIFRPKNIDEDEDKNIDRKMKLFNYLFAYYKTSISYIARKINDCEFFVDILNCQELDTINGVDFDENSVKKAIIKVCSKRKIFDPKIIKIVNKDMITAKTSVKTVKPVPKIRFV